MKLQKCIKCSTTILIIIGFLQFGQEALCLDCESNFDEPDIIEMKYNDFNNTRTDFSYAVSGASDTTSSITKSLKYTIEL